ncbi:MAG TPA: gluconokinase [Vicinamibacterales bacterium]|jgi:gluconokinase|nr:gluconokinase [Vicinamibacterales bacterium]
MVIVIMGASGAGKTTVGHALAVELGWRYVEGDDAHPARNVAKMRAGVPLNDADREPWLAALHAIIARAIDRREHMVVACSALKARYRDRLRGDRRTVRFVYLRAAPAALQRRLAQRTSHFFSPALLQSQLATLEEPDEHEALVMDAAWPPERILSAIREAFGV